MLSETNHQAETHFQFYLASFIVRLLANLKAGDARLTGILDKFPFLSGYEKMVLDFQPENLPIGQQVSWWEQNITDWEAEQVGHLPLLALTQSLDLNRDQIRLLIAVGIVEEDARFGALFAALQEPLPARRPSVGMLGWLLGEAGQVNLDSWMLCRPLLESGLLAVDNQTDSRAEWLLHIPPVIWDALRGRPLDKPAAGITRQPAETFPPLENMILPPDLQAQITHLPELLSSGQVNVLVLRGMVGSGRRTVLGAVAAALGRSLLLLDGGTDESKRLLGPLATLLGAIPALRCNPGPGETAEIDVLPGYNGPVGVTLGRSGGLRGTLLTHALSLNLPLPDYEARCRFWQMTHIPLLESDLAEIAARFLVTGGLIHKAAALGFTYSALASRTHLTSQDVQKAMRALNRQTLDTLAAPLEAVKGWSDLVAGQTVIKELEAVESRCRGREILRDEAGPALRGTLNRGVRAMFSGPSGTGKTLAARALSAELEMDLYRVDLASVVNKYIGETERNLNEVFSRAEELDVILLLDEGDALLTKRTDVSNSNDRYANLETNYLLQRLETYEGIVIITTNAAQRIDSAFLRRLDVVIEFGLPDVPERQALWDMHLPVHRSKDMEFADFMATVVQRCTLTGGQIRNAALYATLSALESRKPVNEEHIAAALQREYRKAGGAYPLRKPIVPDGQVERARQFVDDLK